MALKKVEDGWLLQTLAADIALIEPKTPSWTDYDYGDLAFVSEVVTGEQFSKWLSDLQGEARGYRFRIPEPQPRVHYERYASRSSMRQLHRLPYPFTLYPLSPSYTDSGERPSAFTPLVKAGLPSYPSYKTALYRLLYDLDDQRGNDLPREIIIRVAHPEAWIEDIVVESEAVTVNISGDQVGGTRLTIGGPPGVLFDELLDQGGRANTKWPQLAPLTCGSCSHAATAGWMPKKLTRKELRSPGM